MMNSNENKPNKFGEIHVIALSNQQKDLIESRMAAIEAPQGFMTGALRHMFRHFGSLTTYDCFKFFALCAEGCLVSTPHSFFLIQFCFSISVSRCSL